MGVSQTVAAKMVVMVYGTRDEIELEVAMCLVDASFSFAHPEQNTPIPE